MDELARYFEDNDNKVYMPAPRVAFQTLCYVQAHKPGKYFLVQHLNLRLPHFYALNNQALKEFFLPKMEFQIIVPS